MTSMIRVMQQKIGLCMLTPASTFSSPPEDDNDDDKKPPTTVSSSESRSEALDTRLKALTIKEQYDNNTRRYMIVRNTEDEMKPSKDQPFLVRTRISMNGDEVIYLDLKSHILQREMKKVLGNIPNINLDVTSASVEVRVLFHWIWKLMEYKEEIEGGEYEDDEEEAKEAKEDEDDGDEGSEESKQDKQDNEDGLSPDLELLIHWAEKYHGSVQEEVDAVVKRGKIRFELLWALFKPSDRLYLRCPQTEVPMCVVYMSGMEVVDGHTDRPMFSITSQYVTRGEDGQPSLSTRNISIQDFWGEKDIKDLDVYPIVYHEQEEQVRKELIARGRTYASLAKLPFAHKMFCGKIFYVDSKSKVVIRYYKGRMVVDPDEFAKHPPGKHRIPHAVRISGDPLWDELDERWLLICSPTVFAYALDLGHFAELAVDHISDIEWDESASFEHDVMLRDKEKRAITAVAEQTLGNTEHAPGKGSTGHFVVFYGGPGVGKTLTANVLAEQHKAPLFQFSSAHHDSGAEKLELYVDLIFTLCCRWKAVLLMDEGDVYLSKRFIGYNAVVAVFLRHIELYRGLLIVTTNRYSAMDDAVIDRMSLPVEYPPLTKEQRLELWQKTLVKQGQEGRLSDSDIADLAQNKWNGRQIGNCLKLAVAFAGKASLTFGHLKDAVELQLQRMEASAREREEDSKRSYF